MSVMLNLFPGSEAANIEFKQAYSPSLLKTVSAFANQHDGVILLGIDDQGQIMGIQDELKLRLTIENAINDNIDPRPFFEIQSRQVEGKTVILLKIQKGEHTPYYYGQKAYVRSDTATVQADRLTLNRLILDGQGSNFEDLPSADQRLGFIVLKDYFRQSLGVQSLSTDLQKTLNLVRNGIRTNAAALLSDQNPIEGASLALLAFANQQLDLSDRLILTHKSLLVQMTTSLDFYHKHLLVSEHIEGAFRQTCEEVPLTAYREAVVNAIIHRDYLLPSQIRIEIHPDRVAICSPGGLPSGITEAEYLDGRHSVFRNPTLADIFMRLGLAEKLTTGVRRIKQYYFGRNKQPEFIILPHSITVILPREICARQPGSRSYAAHDGSSGLLLKDSAPPAVYATGYPDRSPSNHEADYATGVECHIDRLTRHLRQAGSITRSDAEALLGLGKTQAFKILRQMEQSGRIYRSGEGRCSRYHLLER